MRIEVDRDVCVGSGMCAFTAPDVFEQDRLGLVLLVDPEPGADRFEHVEEARESCPAAAIHLH
jgi:ferredoxin